MEEVENYLIKKIVHNKYCYEGYSPENRNLDTFALSTSYARQWNPPHS